MLTLKFPMNYLYNTTGAHGSLQTDKNGKSLPWAAHSFKHIDAYWQSGNFRKSAISQDRWSMRAKSSIILEE